MWIANEKNLCFPINLDFVITFWKSSGQTLLFLFDNGKEIQWSFPTEQECEHAWHTILNDLMRLSERERFPPASAAEKAYLENTDVI